MSDVDHCRDEYRDCEREDDRQDPERSGWSARDVDETDGHRNPEGTEMTGIVDRGGAFTEQQTGRGQHQLGGGDSGEGEPNPLATADRGCARAGTPVARSGMVSASRTRRTRLT